MPIGAIPTGLACLGACVAQMMSADARDGVAEMIRTSGARAAVASLSQGGVEDGTRWGAMLTAIQTGDPGWLRVAAALRPGTDAATAETLLLALSTALRRNAAGVLSVMGPQLRPEDLCFPRMIEPRPIDLKVFQVHTHDALAAVGDPKLRGLRDRCLAIVDSGPAGAP